MPGCGCMCNDISSDWFLWVSSKHGGSVHLSYHLVTDHHRHTKLNQRKDVQEKVLLNCKIYSQLLLTISSTMSENSYYIQCNADLIGKSEKCPEEPAQVHLTGTQLSSARVVCPIEGSRTVHYQENISVSVGSSRKVSTVML